MSLHKWPYANEIGGRAFGNAMFWYWAAVLRDATQQLRQLVRDRR